MTAEARSVRRVYLALMLTSTLATSFIWGINTLFLLDAGLSNTAAFTANAFFTLGMVIFEVPTGVVADLWGRRASYMLGAFGLLASTLVYLVMWQIGAPFWAWALASAFIGLGYTFFSGAIEAWLVDALAAAGFDGDLDSVFAAGQIVAGIAMLGGSVAGGVIAQLTDLGVPYILRAAALGVTLLTAFFFMRDLGFEPERTTHALGEMRRILRASIDNGLRNRPVRWVMLAAPFTTGVSFYAFYAMQPYLLDLYGDDTAFAIAGLAAAIVAGAQILGGIAVPLARRVFTRRTHILVFLATLSAAALLVAGITTSFWVAIGCIVLWAIGYAAAIPVRQAYVNGLIPSRERATVLSFDSLMGSTGGVVTQPSLGRAADVWSYGTSYLIAAGIQALAIPFVVLARGEDAESDPILAPGSEAQTDRFGEDGSPT
jgi:MFS family permease